MITTDFLHIHNESRPPPVQGNPTQAGEKRSALKTVYPLHEATTHVKMIKSMFSLLFNRHHIPFKGFHKSQLHTKATRILAGNPDL